MLFEVKFVENTQRIVPEINSTGQPFAVDFGVVNTVTSAPDAEVYTGEYEVTPKAEEDQTLPTAQKFLTKDVTVRKIQYYEMDNDAGGKTIYIGTDADLIVE